MATDGSREPAGAPDEEHDPEHLRRRHAAILPNLITVGNAVCGFVALTHIANVRVVDGQIVNAQYFTTAAWFILLGMVFDVFDGRIARLTGGTSDLGAQLDSMSDLVTFGLAPAGLMVKLHHTMSMTAGGTVPWGRVVWVFGLAYFIGTMLRLSRFNVEHDDAEEAHHCFQGIPSPGAAGTVASLVLVWSWLREWRSWELVGWSESAPEWALALSNAIPFALPFLTFALGYAMVSTRFSYPHVGSQLLEQRRSHNYFVTLVFAGILVYFLVEPMLCVIFLGYTLWTPIRTLKASFGRGKP